MGCEHHGKRAAPGTACLGTMGWKQYGAVPEASAPRSEREDVTRARVGLGCLPIFQLACLQMICLSVLSLIQLKRNSSTPIPVYNELDIQRKCLQKRSQEGGGSSLAAPALPCSSSLLQDKGPGLVSLKVLALPTCHQSPPPVGFPSLSVCLPPH